MRLVSCTSCHAQYDVSRYAEPELVCRCGTRVDCAPARPVDQPTKRCSACGGPLEPDATACSFCRATVAHDDAKLSLLCPECYARNEEEARFCAACGVAFDPHDPPGSGWDGPVLRCPDCTRELMRRQVGGFPVDECGGCQGLWVFADHFDSLIERAVALRRQDPLAVGRTAPRHSGHNPARQTIAYRRCPACDAYMQRRNFRKRSGVILDVCRDHGTWLDPDELERIAGFIQSGGLDRVEVPDRERENANAEFTRILAERRAGIFSPEREERGGVLRTAFEILSELLVR